MSVSQIVERHI